MLFFSGAFWKGWDAMRSVMEFMAAATLGTVAIWLLRKRWHHFTAMAFVMGGLILLLATPRVTSAAEVRHGDPSYTLPAGQEVNTDLIVAGDHIEIDGTVDGDLIVFSRNVVVNGHVKGDILSFVGDLTMNGTVDGNIRAANQSMTINGTVGKNVMSWGQDWTLADKASVGGSATLGDANAEVDGHLGGDLLAISGMTVLKGTLGRNVDVRGGRLKIGPEAILQGQIKFTGQQTPQIAVGAKLASAPIVTIRRPGPDYAHFAYYWNETIRWGEAFLFGLVLLLAAPVFFGRVVQACGNVAPSIGLGVLFLFATPIAAIFACFTIVGLGLGVVAVLLYLVALYSTQVFVAGWIGEKLLGVGKGIGPAIGRLALGLLILRGLAILPIVGWMVILATLIWGLGAMALTFHKLMRSRAPVEALAAD
jgi:cytoskeletal protein CcmA (bactofilin family)